MSPNFFRRLDVVPVAAGLRQGLKLVDRETGEDLPGQVSGSLFYNAGDELSRLTVEFEVDGGLIRMADAARQRAAQDASYYEFSAEGNDLAAAARAFGALSETNRERFLVMHGLAERPLSAGPRGGPLDALTTAAGLFGILVDEITVERGIVDGPTADGGWITREGTNARTILIKGRAI